MENLNEACWEGYKQVGMKNKGGKMVPNCVPMKESILKFAQALATAKSAANKPLAGKKSEPKLPSASGVVKGGAPEPKTYEIPEEPKKFDSSAFAAGIEKLKKKKLEEAPKETKPNFDDMTDEERRAYMANKAERGVPHAELRLLANQQARFAMRKPLEEETDEYCPRCMMEVLTGQHPEQLGEAQYQGRTVQLGKPMRGDVKKFKVFVKDPSTGNVKKVNFGDKTMKIKKSNPARRKSFRARHHCDTNPGPRTKARYWSCRKW